ncbi:MAG: CDP-alcohol phosphatidyltransferase family protein [Candidatus Kerfeldbacteria bacterium]|nr:CDP-alcohol phosphatidyltransferase family protein [Candidatus Kerfeldbacteria bacterium]
MHIPPALERFAHWKDRLVFPIVDRLPRSLHPNHLTVLRGLLIAPMILLLWSHHYAWGFTIFVVAAFTDFLDGALARRRHHITNVGKILDPGTDRFLIYGVLFTFGWEALPHSILWTMFILDLIHAILGLIVYLLQGKTHLPFPGPNIWGKTKNTLQLLGILFLFAALTRPLLVFASLTLFAFAIICSILAMEHDILQRRTT